jgi:mono/diheme cytochrome c family protein
MKRISKLILKIITLSLFFAFTVTDATDGQGAAAFKRYSCTSCHGNTGKAIADLTNASLKYSDEQVKNYIRKPSAFNNRKMPSFSGIINEADLDLLVQYVKFLGKKNELYNFTFNIVIVCFCDLHIHELSYRQFFI